MTEYKIEHKDAFNITAYGTTIEMPYESIPAQKSDFWKAIEADGRWAKLKSVAKNGLEFAVNEAINGAMWYYSGVESDKEIEDATRLIEFPDGDYLILKGSAPQPGQLFAQLEGAAFSEVLGSLSDYAYTGGPNTSVQTDQKDGMFYGEIWIPLTKK
ncbi:MAG: GyrI-like domain-containing protein [Streptococcaceae bacterium]|jgi:predicted transcriptional regulator YdeE|nr:GyrI-like domain-containing protein [Streptococcaceae bacterium]